MSFTIGSLFDGSGGFPLAASLCGGIPKWSSEIEPYPIAVTKSRFPGIKHLGSVTDIKGGEVEPVDVITFGSPCQDLSVAGKRAGLKHTDNGDDETTRSGLFMEAVRIIKEMREATNGVYPRFALWENVPGAFSSNKGEDFRIVLQELIQIAEPTAVMPEVPKNGWPYADSYCGDGWSIAYRVLDAQFWGVPQRRRRIYLVADFRGECAGKVSFEREGLRGYFETGRTPWQATPGNAEDGSGTADCEGIDGYNSTLTGDKSSTLGVNCGMSTGRNGVVYALDQQGGKGGANYAENVMPTLCSDSHGTPHAVAYPICMATQQGGAEIMEDKCPTITASAGMSGNNQPVVCYPDMVLDDQGGSQISVRDDGKCPTLRAETHGNLPCVLSIENHPADSRVNIDGSGKVQTLTSRMGTGGGNVPMVMEPIPIHDQATRFSGKHGDKSDGKGNGLGVGNPGDPMNTITAGDRHAVCFWDGTQTVSTLTANNAGGNQRMPDKENFNCVVEMHDAVTCTDVGWWNTEENQSPTLLARMYKDPHLVSYSENATNYIVRRLTPTECARLQGFPDTWGHPVEKTELTDEEYQFWLNVRNTHAAINEKAVKDYTKDQMLKWYNGLHTDSSEYKMWGNGIALPNALYVMQGIADVMSEEKAARKKWLYDLLK